MTDTRIADAARVARAAMAAIAARGKGGAPPPNDRDPRRVTAHLGAYKIEAEYPAGRADAALTIDRDGALVLKATVEPVWDGQRRKDDRIDILEARGDDWFADFLTQAPPPERAKDEGAAAKPAATAQRKARARPKARARAAKPKRGAKAAGGKAAGAKGASAKGRAAKAGSRARPNRSKTPKRPGRR